MFPYLFLNFFGLVFCNLSLNFKIETGSYHTLTKSYISCLAAFKQRGYYFTNTGWSNILKIL